jgi:hypothetical protein
MASVAALRMSGKLDKVLPASLLPPSTILAQGQSTEPTPTMGAMGMHH